jgi:hypothetical protein
MADAVEVLVLLHPFPIAVTEPERPGKRGQGVAAGAEEAVTAGEVVENHRVVGKEDGEFQIHRQALFMETAAGIGVAQGDEDVDKIGVVPKEILKELDLESEIVSHGRGPGA